MCRAGASGFQDVVYRQCKTTGQCFATSSRRTGKGLRKAAVKLRKRIEGLLDNVSSEETDIEQDKELRRLEKRQAYLDAARNIFIAVPAYRMGCLL
jgi:hypothetical protein